MGEDREGELREEWEGVEQLEPEEEEKEENRGIFESHSLGGLNKNHSSKNKNHSSKNKNHSSIPFQNMATTHSVKILNNFLKRKGIMVCAMCKQWFQFLSS